MLTKKVYVAVAVVLGALSIQGADAEENTTKQDDDNQETEVIEVVGEGIDGNGVYLEKDASSATGMGLTLRETPQAISVVTRAQMDDFALQNINDVLQVTSGVNVEKVETDRTYYSARGFDITNFEYDGVGVPFVYGNTYGDIDVAIYDRIEVIRGANGLMSGTGNPSATVNFVRKRPTDDFHASIAAIAGSWDNQRVETDISGSLNEDGSIRGRFVGAYQNKDSYLNRYSVEKEIFYGVLEFDLSEDAILTVGHTSQDNKPNSPMWGALTLNYTDGTQVDYDVSRSTATDWSYWDGTINRTFAELVYNLGHDWELVTTISKRKDTINSALFYAYSAGGLNPDRSGLFAYSSLYGYKNEQLLADIALNGSFNLAGRSHQANFGVNWSRSEADDVSVYGQDIGTSLPSFDDWTGDYPRPGFGPYENGSDFTDELKSFYAAARWSLADELSLITGFRSTSMDSEGTSYGQPKEYNIDNEITPYAGVVYDVSDNLSLYGSYTKIFNPQREKNIHGDRLDPVDGVNYELGIKGEFFDDMLNVSFAVFDTEQNNIAEYAGTDTTTGQDYFIGVDGVSSQGYEFDVMGQVAKGLQLSGGFTHVDIEGANGEDVRTFTPRNTLRLSGSYTFPEFEALRLGMNVRWQDDIYRDQGVATTGVNAGQPFSVEQDSYAVVGLMAGYEISDNLSATFNVDNVTDEKYLTSLYWAQGYYGAPRNYTLTVRWGM
ncbi:TonB-dependent siderophore receptor [Kangiella shandongensis]|uniref:TonB-dependent siderophore receptor n=1 Tax=Kangiella shandongensis TaxID=2763258 RepID=UPI001CBB1238|nr:TonB-dependent siderophore receptor [Kangiella shandongensis]